MAPRDESLADLWDYATLARIENGTLWQASIRCSSLTAARRTVSLVRPALLTTHLAATPSFIIRTQRIPPRLVATTWFAVADVLYYIQDYLAPELGDALPESIQILDFNAAKIIAYNGSKQLTALARLYCHE